MVKSTRWKKNSASQQSESELCCFISNASCRLFLPLLKNWKIPVSDCERHLPGWREVTEKKEEKGEREKRALSERRERNKKGGKKGGDNAGGGRRKKEGEKRKKRKNRKKIERTWKRTDNSDVLQLEGYPYCKLDTSKYIYSIHTYGVRENSR